MHAPHGEQQFTFALMRNQYNRINGQLGIWLPLLFALVLVIGLFIGMRLQSASPSPMVEAPVSDEVLTFGQGRVEELLRYIEAKYVDEVDREELIRQAINEVLRNLDPHSNYIPAEELQEINEQLEGNFDGIGIEFMVLDDTIVVVAPLSGGPAEAVGVQAGDKIVMIEDSTVAGQQLSNRDIVSLLRGEKGTPVNIGVRRPGENSLLRFNIKRDEIPMHSVDVAYMLDEQTGYVKINRFSATTYEEFVQALEQLVEKKGMRDLVLDLRGNPGGYLQQATNMLSQLFQERGKLLVYTEGRSVNRTEYETSGRAFYSLGDVVVLIDEGSASASEIVAGAVQDHDRGVIIGRRSFGKGLVQEQYPLSDGSALRLTVARYYTPSGRSIQRPYENPEDYEMDMLHRLEEGELSTGNLPLPDSIQKYYTDNGHVVYGGGGIMPDIYIPLDTTLLDEEYILLRQHIPAFIFREATENRQQYANTDLDRFRHQFRVDDALYNKFLVYARQHGQEDLPEETPRLRREIKRYLKARLAKQLFGDEGFFTVWNQDDEMVAKALEVLNQPNPLAAARTSSGDFSRQAKMNR